MTTDAGERKKKEKKSEEHRNPSRSPRLQGQHEDPEIEAPTPGPLAPPPPPSLPHFMEKSTTAAAVGASVTQKTLYMQQHSSIECDLLSQISGGWLVVTMFCRAFRALPPTLTSVADEISASRWPQHLVPRNAHPACCSRMKSRTMSRSHHDRASLGRP